MKIENNLPPVNRNNSERLSGSKKVEGGKGEKLSGASSGPDRAIISEEAQLFSKAMMKMIDIPDTRQTIVQNIKSQIMDGKYQIHHEELASILFSKGIVE